MITYVRSFVWAEKIKEKSKYYRNNFYQWRSSGQTIFCRHSNGKKAARYTCPVIILHSGDRHVLPRHSQFGNCHHHHHHHRRRHRRRRRRHRHRHHHHRRQNGIETRIPEIKDFKIKHQNSKNNVQLSCNGSIEKSLH